MITAILKLQGCTTKPGRRAFVGKDWPRHGIAAGNIRHYRVIAPTWAAIRRTVAGYDSTGAKTMGFTGIGPLTVESFSEDGRTGTASEIRPLPVGFKPASEPAQP
jgi:hypothetical protein